MGLGNVAVNVVWKLAVVAIYAALYELTPLRLDPGDWWVWVLLFFADDLAYYWFHRVSHESRVFWASHVVHHSSQHYNLSTALRQTWVPMTYLPFWLPLLLLGFPPWMVLLAQSWSLIYQFGLHTERIGRLPRPLEAVLNTPSHHRVHHGANEQYLDRNYGGILVIWDRLFGTFEPEGERVRYGLTTTSRRSTSFKVAFHEYAAPSAATCARARRGACAGSAVLLRGPGYEPPRSLEQAREPAVLEDPALGLVAAGSSSSRSPRRRPPRAPSRTAGTARPGGRARASAWGTSRAAAAATCAS